MIRIGLLAPVTAAVMATICLLAARPAAAIDAVFIEGGITEDRVDAQRYGGAFRWDFKPQWWQVGSWHMSSYIEASIDYWDAARGGTTGKNDLVDLGVTPVLRYQSDPAHGFAPFIEVGLGVHGHSRNGIEDKDFDIPFAFGEHLGLGARFGEAGKYEFIYRYQHQSNAGLGDLNPGINFHSLSLGLHF